MRASFRLIFQLEYANSASINTWWWRTMTEALPRPSAHQPDSPGELQGALSSFSANAGLDKSLRKIEHEQGWQPCQD